MAKWAHADVLDNGPAYIKANCNKILAVLAYAAGDTYATASGAANIVAEFVVTASDFTLGTGALPNSRRLTGPSGKQDISANNTGDPTHFVYIDTVNSKVLIATDETGSQTVVSGNTVTLPVLTYDSNQPT